MEEHKQIYYQFRDNNAYPSQSEFNSILPTKYLTEYNHTLLSQIYNDPFNLEINKNIFDQIKLSGGTQATNNNLLSLMGYGPMKKLKDQNIKVYNTIYCMLTNLII